MCLCACVTLFVCLFVYLFAWALVEGVRLALIPVRCPLSLSVIRYQCPQYGTFDTDAVLLDSFFAHSSAVECPGMRVLDTSVDAGLWVIPRTGAQLCAPRARAPSCASRWTFVQRRLVACVS